VLRYSVVAETYDQIEKTTKRLEMTDHLVNLLKQTPRDLIDKIVYLTQGKLYPDFLGIEIGVAEKLAVRAVAKATGFSEDQLQQDIETTGDLGETTQHFILKKRQTAFFSTPLRVQSVYKTIDRMAKAMGPGSMAQKIKLLAGLLTDATPKEAKYITRTVTGRLRLGIADMTVLDALAIAYGAS
jgi:DNA ligase-1